MRICIYFKARSGSAFTTIRRKSMRIWNTAQKFLVIFRLAARDCWSGNRYFFIFTVFRATGIYLHGELWLAKICWKFPNCGYVPVPVPYGYLLYYFWILRLFFIRLLRCFPQLFIDIRIQRHYAEKCLAYCLPKNVTLPVMGCFRYRCCWCQL
jgi:hypothetical protein